ncbi:MAG TPA: hypothetical protein VG537_05895, partial [Candidatus Kapabacteria bacterium]|nr:hypothetical protein [Candidatus Kapabacteria bacterium]
MKRVHSLYHSIFAWALFGLFFASNVFAQWETDRRISNDTSAHLNENMGQCLAVSGDSVHVVWWDSNAIYYKHSFDGGTNWSADTRLTDATIEVDFPSIAVSGNTIHIAFRDTTGGVYASYYMRSLDGGNTWEPKILLGNYYWWPSITASAGAVFVALNSNAPGNSEVWFLRSLDNGTTWDTVRQISNAAGRSEDPS